MAMYSTNGVRRSVNISATLASDGAEAITQVSEPNVGQFGWTTQDLRSVKDLVRWVNAAMEAATSAETNAEYVQDSVLYVQKQTTKIDAALTESNALLASSTTLYNNFKTESLPVMNKLDVFNTQYADFLVKYADFIIKWNKWNDSLTPVVPPQ